MKRFKLLLPLMSLALTGCIFDHWGSSGLGDLEVKYVLKSGEESNGSITIDYGESFNIKEFKLYCSTKRKTEVLNSNDYTVTFTEGNKESFFSDKPEVGRYIVLFEYKTKTTSIDFIIDKADNINPEAHLELHDMYFKEVAAKPQLLGCVDTTYYSAHFTAICIDEDGSELFRTSYPYLEHDEDNPCLMTLVPGTYKVEGNFYTDHYYESNVVSNTFRVFKIAFPSELYRVSFNFGYNKYIPGYDKIGDYTLPSYPKVVDRETGHEVIDVYSSDAYLEWKNPNDTISTTEQRTYPVIFHSPYFNDYEFNITVNLNKHEVEKPSGFYIRNTSTNVAQFDGAEYEVHWFWVSGAYYMDESSVVKATNPGEYEIRFKLDNPEHCVWKGTTSSEDFVYTWTITKGPWHKLLTAYEFRINGVKLTESQNPNDNVFLASNFIGKIELWFKYKGSDEFVEYTNFTTTKDASMYADHVTLVNNEIISVEPATYNLEFAISYVVENDCISLVGYWWFRITFS